MYYFGYDRASACLVIESRGEMVNDADHAAILEWMLRLDKEARDHPDGTLAVLIISPSDPPPGPEWQARFAGSNQHITARRALFVLVTTSPENLDALVKIISMEPGSKREFGAFASFDEAVRWAERKRDKQLPVLYRLRGELSAREAPIPLPS
jgi:hypothetical protein